VQQQGGFFLGARNRDAKVVIVLVLPENRSIDEDSLDILLAYRFCFDSLDVTGQFTVRQ